MAIQSGFFNANVTIDSQTGLPVYDRAGTAEQFAHYFSRFVRNGVFMQVSTSFQVLADTGMSLTVKAGDAWINGYFAWADVDDTISIASAPTSNPRIDRIVLRLDLTQSGRAISLAVLQGTPAAEPVAPSLTRGADVYEIALADVTVRVNTTSITQADINDRRLDNNLCGVVTSLIDQVDTTTLYAQIQADLNQFQTVSQAEFEAWVQTIEGILDEETAGHLLLLIQQNAAAIQTLEDQIPQGYVQVTPQSGTVTLSKADVPGGCFYVEQGQNLTYAFDFGTGLSPFISLAIKMTAGSTTTTFNGVTPSNLGNWVDNTNGTMTIINFAKVGNTIKGYVLES